MNRQAKPTRKVAKVTKAKTTKKSVVSTKRKIATKVAKKSVTRSTAVAASVSSQQTNNITMRFQPQQQQSLFTTPTTLNTTSFATFSTHQQFTPSLFTKSHHMKSTYAMPLASTTTLPANITAKISAMNFLPPAASPQKTSKRTFLGNIGSGLGNLFGKKPAAGGDDGVQHGVGSMMQMMEMMQMMQKVTNMVKGGKPTEQEYQEICDYIEKLRTQRGGKLPAEIDQLLQKIQNREPINQDEVMVLLGITPSEAVEIRDMTLQVKAGKVNQMAYMMKVAEIFQKAQQRKEAAATEGAPNDAEKITK